MKKNQYLIVDNIVKYIQDRVSPDHWSIYGFSIGDDFDSIINDSSLYEKSKTVKRYNGAQFYKAKDSNLIAGVFLSIPFFDTRQEEVLDVIKISFGPPYFDHVKMKDRVLYYPSHKLYIQIIEDDISKGLCLSIGECGTNLQTFTASNIIESYYGLMNQHAFLLESENRGSLPKLVRLQIEVLESLLLAFLGDSSIKRFMTGTFILECDDIYLNKLVKSIGEIEIYKSPKRSESTIIDTPSRRELLEFWGVLFQYYIDSQLYMERTSLFHYTTWKKEQLEEMKIISSKERVISRLESLKNYLCKFIDPEGKEFDLKEMTSEYDYPKEDIECLKANDY